MFHRNKNFFISLVCLPAILVFLSAQSVYARGNLPNFAELVRDNSDAVVNVSTVRKVSARRMIPERYRTPEGNELLDELMKRFFDFDGEEGGEGPFNYDNSASGSGFILSEDGYVVTNHHVVDGADEIIVRLNDRREIKAELVGSDKRSDIALLKIDEKGLPVLAIGDSSEVEVGEWVLAIGSPFGFESSATSGIVSATGRSLPRDSYVPFIQTDVAINPGNSGGPLFNLDGEVIGINSQIYSRSGGFMGLSFSIPINMAMGVIEQLRNTGKVSRGWIGVYIQNVTQELANSFGMEAPTGALVSQVMEDAPSMGKLQAGDVILEFDGREVESSGALPTIVGVIGAGKEVDVVILRNKERQTVQLTVGELPGEEELLTRGRVEAEPKSVEKKPGVRLGIEAVALEDIARQGLGITSGGVLVERVVGDPARKAGVVAGDVITMIDGKVIESPEALDKILGDLKGNSTVAVLIRREGAARFLAMKIE